MTLVFKERDDALADAAIANARIQELTVSVDRLESDNIDLTTERNAALEKNSIYDAALYESYSKIDTFMCAAETADETITEQSQLLLTLEATIAGMKEQFQEEVDRYDRHLSEIGARNESLQESLGAAEEKIRQLGAPPLAAQTLTNMNKRNMQLQKSLDVAEATNRQLRDELTKANSRAAPIPPISVVPPHPSPAVSSTPVIGPLFSPPTGGSFGAFSGRLGQPQPLLLPRTNSMTTSSPHGSYPTTAQYLT